MGLGASTSGGLSQEEQEEESMAASTGSLSMLRNAFAKLSDPATKAIPLNSLKEIFCLNFSNLLCRSSSIPESFPQLLINLGPSIVDLFFMTGKEGVSWVDFLRGYNRCCGRMPASVSSTNLYQLYSATSRKTDNPSKLDFDADNGKVSGNLKLADVLMLLWMCWIMSRSQRTSKLPKDNTTLLIPDLNHLITSAHISCNEVDDDSSIRECAIKGFEKDVCAQKLCLWVLTTVPGLVHCLPQYVQDRLQKCAAMEGDPDCSHISADDNSSGDVYDGYLLTCGSAWAISLTLRTTTSEELLMACFSRKETRSPDNLLYKSSIHGKGLTRFWSNIEGYHGSLLILVSASLVDASEGDTSCRSWVIGMLTGQGLENGGTFHGSSGHLYALSPIFRVFPPSGKDKNFVYCHLHPTGRFYDAHPKPVGFAFGGTVGNERIFMDEDFARITVRHHAVDKTYQSGSLVPGQGFLATEASVVEVEVWGFGGKAARQQQDVYKKREQLFSEQRRKVDLKTFGSWEESPEKMIMDMVSDPNRVQREDR